MSRQFSRAERLWFLWQLARADAHVRAQQARASLEAAIAEEAERIGITARARDLEAAFETPAFSAAFKAAATAAIGTPRAPRTANDVRAMALEVLAGMGVATEGVLFTVSWNATEKRLTFTVRGPMPEVRAACIEAIRARAAAPVETAEGRA